MKTRITIYLNDLNKIKSFTKAVGTFACDIDLIKGRYVIDSKSAIGIFTLDLSSPVDVLIHSEDKKEIRRFNEIMEEFR